MTDDREQFNHNEGWKSESVAREYDAKRFSSLAGRLYNKREQQAISELLDLASRQEKIETILDLPCGTGRISELLVRRGHDVTCADISQEMLDVARERLASYTPGPSEYAIMDIYNIDRPDNSFDCVTCIRLFQHLTSDERARALRELGRVSRRYVIVNVMYTSFYYGILRGIRKVLGRYAPRYTSSRKEIQRETAAASLRVVRSIFPQPGYQGNLVLLLEKET